MISLVGIMVLFPTLLIGQILDPEIYSYDCIDEEDNAFVDTIYRGLYESLGFVETFLYLKNSVT